MSLSLKKKNAKKKRQFSYQTGFSLLEVLITAAIIGIITGLVVFQYGSFNNVILLKNQAFQVALDLREMQTRALSSVGQSTSFRDPYGVYFSTSNTDQYILFVDDGDGVYESGEEIDVRHLDNRFYIGSLCDGGDCTLTTLSITFVRPNFDAIMSDGGTSVANGEVNLTSKSDDTAVRTVVINAAGQIVVQ